VLDLRHSLSPLCFLHQVVLHLLAFGTDARWELGDKLAYSSSGAFGYMLGFFAVDFATHDLRITFGEGSFFMCFGIRGFEALSFCAFS